MNRSLTAILLFFIPLISFAQKEQTKDTVQNGWKKEGTVSLLFNQAAFNKEWTGGGTTNYSANLKLTYDLNYRRNRISWDNRFLADYGLTKNRDDKYSRKTNDRLEYNSIFGFEIKDTNWFYSFFTNFKTQFSKGYEFDKDLEQNDPGYRTETTHFLSPAYLQFGPGMLWKKSDNFYVNLAPATAKFIFVDKMFTYVDESIPGALEAYNEDKYFGVDANKSSRFEFGASVSAYAKFAIMTNVTAENILNLYSNYLENPQNVDLDYTLNVKMKVNDFLTSNVTFQAIYDDDAVGGFQIREALGVGVTYSF